ncbi:BPSS1780 family membrane protein [Pseudoxanthomonas sp. 10H]|uniref:BPSS1780 family membrane protein n=1 Tax=Pseudoxanthomonas sp. 10H TaxID=3242729 RepID=UPI0035571998
MDTIRRLPASDGAEWLLGGFALLRRAPLALGTLGALWGLLASLVVTVGLAVPALATILQLLVALAGPVLFAGLLWAVHEVAHDRPALPGHLLHAAREGRVPALLATLLPQVAAGLLLGMLLLVLVGPQQLQHLAEVSHELNALAQSGQQATPEQVEALVGDLPAGRILLWLLLGVAAAVAVAMTVFVAVPRILFDRREGLQAMGDSLRACVANLPALAVFLLLTMVAIFAVYFGVLLVALVLQLLAGPMVAMWAAQLLLMAVLMPLLAGAVYTAWLRLFRDEPPAAAVASGRFEA